jgi:FAD/FMN-containing dehydrogenase
LHFNKGLAGGADEHIRAAADTATNPQALSAFALAIIADGGASVYPGVSDAAGPDVDEARRKREAIAAAMRALKVVAPDAGSYVSESNFFEPAWQRSFWGDRNHARLRAVKAKYDSQGLFFVHHGVGSDQWSADGFARTTE